MYNYYYLKLALVHSIIYKLVYPSEYIAKYMYILQAISKRQIGRKLSFS